MCCSICDTCLQILPSKEPLSLFLFSETIQALARLVCCPPAKHFSRESLNRQSLDALFCTILDSAVEKMPPGKKSPLLAKKTRSFSKRPHLNTVQLQLPLVDTGRSVLQRAIALHEAPCRPPLASFYALQSASTDRNQCCPLAPPFTPARLSSNKHATWIHPRSVQRINSRSAAPSNYA